MGEPHPALEDAKALVGNVIADRYRVDSVLGAGGMGAVFRCHHLTLKRDVAVKILHPELTSDPEVAPRFDREAQSASRLEHPNVMQVFDYGSWQPHPSRPPVKYMVMQLLDGHELTDLLGQPLRPARAVELMTQIARGLEHAHERGVIHRDLKPENVYVTKDHAGNELLKLVDFGIAKIVSGEGAEDKLTRMGLVFGTPHYMSPEQATGSEVDARSDIYSAGAMFYEMLYGDVPFQSDDPVSVIRMQVAADLPPLPPDIPPPLVALVERMMEKEKTKRFQTATELRQSLDAVAPMLARAPVPDTAPSVDTSAATMAVSAAHLRKPSLADRVGLPPVALYGIGGATAFILLLVVIVMARNDGDEAGSEGVGKKAEPADPIEEMGKALKQVVDSGAPADEVEALDRLIATNQDVEALTMLDSLVSEYPEDPQLQWRRGKLLARDKKKVTTALLAFREAIELDTELLDDREFYAELLEVMRAPEVLGDAIELALGPMGEHGHPFLLELINREAGALGYPDRHRILAKLNDDEQMEKLIDRRLNLVHDLWQAETTERPCEIFDKALRVMELAPEPYYLGTVHKVKVPKSKDASDKPKCTGIGERLMKLRLDLSARYPDADKERWIPPDYKKKAAAAVASAESSAASGFERLPDRGTASRLAEPCVGSRSSLSWGSRLVAAKESSLRSPSGPITDPRCVSSRRFPKPTATSRSRALAPSKRRRTTSRT
jgi:hypothetical protein